MEIGVMFWAGRDNLAELRKLGVQSGQLGVGGDTPLTSASAVEWREAIGEAHFSIATWSAHTQEKITRTSQPFSGPSASFLRQRAKSEKRELSKPATLPLRSV